MRTARFVLLALGLAIPIALVVTHPLAGALGTHVLEDGSYDPFQFIWNIWWVRESLLDLHTDPFFTRLLFYPTGVPLVFHTFSFPLGLASVPLQVTLPGGVVAAHNVLVLAAPALGFVATALLAREVTDDPVAALAAGFVGAVSPIAVWFLPVLYLDCTYLVAFTLWAWWRLQRARRIGWIAAVVALALTLVFASQEYAMMALALLLLDTVLRAVAANALGVPRLWWTGSAVVWGVLLVVLGALAHAALGAAANPPPPAQLLLGSAFVAGFVVPPWLVPPATSFWTLLYLGTTPLLLLPIALARGGRRAWLWAAALAAALMMALGPYLHWQHPLPTLKIPPGGVQPSGPRGPYALALAVVPLLRWFRAPYRWVAVAQIALAVLVALATAALRARAGARRRAVTALVCAALVLGAAVDTRGLRAPLVAADVPPVYDAIRDGAGRGAVLELPAGFVKDQFALYSSLYMFYQTRHRRPLLDGTVSRTPPGAQFTWQRTFPDFGALPYVEWVVVHHDLAATAYPSSREQIAQVEGVLATQGEVVSRNERTTLYHLRTFRPDAVR